MEESNEGLCFVCQSRLPTGTRGALCQRCRGAADQLDAEYGRATGKRCRYCDTLLLRDEDDRGICIDCDEAL